MEISEWVRAARGRMNQTAFGAIVGVSKQNVSAWEHGRHEPSFSQMQQISAATDHPMPPGLLNDAAAGRGDLAFVAALVQGIADLSAEQRQQVLLYVSALAGKPAPLHKVPRSSQRTRQAPIRPVDMRRASDFRKTWADPVSGGDGASH